MKEQTVVAQHNILICSSVEDNVNVIKETVGSLVSYHLEEINLADFLRLKPNKRKKDYGLIFIDLQNGDALGTTALASAKQSYGDIPVVFLSEQLPDQKIRELIKLDGADWLTYPITGNSVREVIKIIDDQSDNKISQVHAIISSGGGSGATSFSLALAHCLRNLKKKDPYSVSVLDLDFVTSAVGPYLNTTNNYKLAEAAQQPDRIDLEFIEVIKKRYKDEFDIFSYDDTGVLHSQYGHDLILRMVDVIAFANDHLVIDLPFNDTPWEKDIISAVNSIIIVTTPLLPHLRRAKKIFEDVKKLSKEGEIIIAVNKVEKSLFGGLKNKDEISKIFEDREIISMNEENQVFVDALNQGILPVEVNKGSKFYTSVKKFATNKFEQKKTAK